MSNIKIIGADVPNMPWQERPADAKDWMPLWRYSENPIIGRNPVEGSSPHLQQCGNTL